MSHEHEVLLMREESRSASWASQHASLQEAGLTTGACIRVIENGRQGLLTTRRWDAGRLPDLIATALEMARVAPEDPHRKLARPAACTLRPFENDDGLFSRSTEEILDELAQLEEKILHVDRRIKKVIKLHISENRIHRSLQNSHGLALTDASTTVGFAVEVLAEDSHESEVAWDMQSRRTDRGMSRDEMARTTALHAAESLGGKPLSSGHHAVVVHPRVGTQFLDLVSHALSAEAVERNRSFFRGKLGQSVAASLVTLKDDPLLPAGVASASFDDEGTPHQTCTMVENGVLKDYFYDLRSASVAGRVSNGHGIKESLAMVPRPDATNFYMQAGSTEVDDMLVSHPHVFHLREVMGLHMADLITGEFSLGASGFLYEHGRKSRPVRGVTIAGNLASVFKGISAIGNDVTWYGSVGAPSFLLPQMMIAGT